VNVTVPWLVPKLAPSIVKLEFTGPEDAGENALMLGPVPICVKFAVTLRFPFVVT
jgi:hypothetical protein